jgi:hypothetical protein
VEVLSKTSKQEQQASLNPNWNRQR